MNQQPKSQAELQQQVRARKAQIDALLQPDRSGRRKPNIPGVILLMSAVCLAYGWEKYHGQKTWGEYWHDLLGRHHWRHPWLVAGFFALALASVIYRLAGSRRAQPAKLWPASVTVAAALVIFGLEACPRNFAWDDLSQAGWWRHHWHGVADFTLDAAILLFGWSCLLIQSRRKKHQAKTAADWQQRLNALVDIHDFKNPEDLFAYLDADERTRLIQLLQAMPQGSRRLAQVCPELTGNAV